MCVMSMVMDHYGDEWGKRFPKYIPGTGIPNTVPLPYTPTPQGTPYIPITQQEIDEFRRLLERAREYDKKNNEPDCEMESKKQKLLDLADALGVKIDFL